MNALFQTLSGYLQHAAGTAPLFDAWLKSLAVLAVAAGLCWLLPRAAAATRHWIWFLAVASLPCLLLLACLPHSWHEPLWSVSTDFNSGNQISLTLNLAAGGRAGSSITPVSTAGTLAAAVSHSSGNTQPFAAQLSSTWLIVVFGIDAGNGGQLTGGAVLPIVPCAVATVRSPWTGEHWLFESRCLFSRWSEFGFGFQSSQAWRGGCCLPWAN
jgi:hypothetical protein